MNFDNTQDRKKIIVAPLNWGLGHATRCIPIINALIHYDFEPIIASDGIALELLKKEFPNLRTLILPSYNITYAKKAQHFKLKLIKDSPQLIQTLKKEKNVIKSLIKKENIAGIISDNRFGVRHKAIPSVFITHQLQVLSGSTTWLSSKMHQNIISKFDECWVPDFEGHPNLSGRLGHLEHTKASVKYLGPLSRFTKDNRPKKNDLLVILSGPEPQRTLLEHQLLKSLEAFEGHVCFVKGLADKTQEITTKGHITMYNYMTSNALETALNESNIVLSRSGYTSIMDYAKLGKKAFFIPTPGQFEQEYLAKKFYQDGIAPYANQNEFNIKLLSDIEKFKGFGGFNLQNDFKSLFHLFESKGKFATDA